MDKDPEREKAQCLENQVSEDTQKQTSEKQLNPEADKELSSDVGTFIYTSSIWHSKIYYLCRLINFYLMLQYPHQQRERVKGNFC